MLARSSIRRIIVTSTALFIIGLIWLFPSTDQENFKFDTSIEYVNVDKAVIYLIDGYNYVARTDIAISGSDTKNIIKEIIESLTIGSTKSQYIPNGFEPLIPMNTKVLDLSLQDKLLKIDFSKDILNITETTETKMIEAIIYTLTEVEDVEEIMIFVEGEQLNELPNSKRKLPPILNRSYGINKEYNINSFKETTKTTIYYISKYKDNYYYVPVTKVTNDNSEKVEVIINSLKSSPIYQTNLISYLATNAELLNYKILEDSIHLSFNNYILTDFEAKNILEEVKYAISLSIKDNYNIKEVTFFVEDEEITNFNLE